MIGPNRPTAVLSVDSWLKMQSFSGSDTQNKLWNCYNRASQSLEINNEISGLTTPIFSIRSHGLAALPNTVEFLDFATCYHAVSAAEPTDSSHIDWYQKLWLSKNPGKSLPEEIERGKFNLRKFFWGFFFILFFF